MSDQDAARRATRRRYAREAATYDRSADLSERWLLGREHRGWACARASGLTLELAIGTGLDLPHYPSGSRVVGLDLTPEMLVRARARAGDLGMLVPLTVGDAQALPFADAVFDSIVCAYAMCSVPDERATVLEMRRVLKPGGALVLVDHIRSSIVPLYWLQRLVERLPGHDRDELTRRPLEHVEAGGFTIEESDRLRAGVLERLVARAPRRGSDDRDRR